MEHEYNDPRFQMLNSLPAFPTDGAPTFDAERWRLRVDGLVERKRDLDLRELMTLPCVRLRDDFTCLEGWMVKGIIWKGVRVSTILGLTSVKPSAKFVLFTAGDYTHTAAIGKSMEPTTILAYELNDAPLPFEHGAPLRLIMQGQECFESIKWVHGVRLIEEYVEGSGRRVALKRLAQNQYGSTV